MGCKRIRRVAQALILAAAGAMLALAATRGFYATALLATLVLVWGAVRTAIDHAAPMPPPAPPAASPGSADRATLQRLTAYLDLSPAPLVALDGTRLRAVNRAARRLLATNDVVSTPPPALCSALADTRPGRTATFALDTAGALKSFALTTSDLAVAGTMLRIGALIDIDSEMKAAEASALRELVQVLSHEIVNALTPIASLAETAVAMLGDPIPALPQVREMVETVARRAAGLQRFGESYRALARLPAPAPQRIALAGFAHDLAALFTARWPEIALVVETQDAPAHLFVDPDQLTAALWAVLQNAAEALDDTLDSAREATIRLTFEARVDCTLIGISDNGPGITAQDARDIFRPFFTTKIAGSGIGLSLARQILRGHGGDLALRASRAGATAFEATIPV